MPKTLFAQLLSALQSADFTQAYELIQASPLILNKPMQPSGLTILAHMVLLQNSAAVEWLLDQGADLTYLLQGGNSLLHEAADNLASEVVAILIAYQANVNARNELGETPLHLSAYRGDLRSVQALLQAGANVNAQTSFSKQSPLHMAVESENVECVRLLLDAYASPYLMDSEGITPKEFAESVGYKHLFGTSTIMTLQINSDLESIPEASYEETLKATSPLGLELALATTEEPDAESTVFGSNLADFLYSHKLETCLSPLIQAGYFSVEKLLKVTVSPEPLNFQILEKIGIAEVGVQAALLLTLDESAGVFIPIEKAYASSFCCSKALTITSIEEWLSQIGLQQEEKKFRTAAYRDMEVLRKQMQSRFPVTHELLHSIGITNAHARSKILKKLLEECGMFVIEKETSALCSCLVF